MSQGLPNKPRKRKRSVQPEEKAEELCILTPWTDAVEGKQYDNVNQRLHYEIKAYVDYMSPTEQEVAAREKVFTLLEIAVKRRFPASTVGVFGSSATGLSLPIADIDIVVSTGQVTDTLNAKPLLFQLSSMLRYYELSNDVFVNHWAKIPIITFTTRPEYGSFSVDIGINNTDGLQVVTIINEYLAIMPALRPLVMVVKGFLKQRGLSSAASSGLGSYAVICMCISFIQLNPGELPAELFAEPEENESFGFLLLDFMTYYGVDFPYTTSYISVTEGKLLPKESAPWINTKVPDRLAVQCLLRPDNDIAKSAQRINAVKTAFKEAAAHLLQASLQDPKLLGHLVCMKQSTVDHRLHIKSLVDSGRLQTNSSAPPQSSSSSRHPQPQPRGLPAKPAFDSHNASSSYADSRRRDNRAPTYDRRNNDNQYYSNSSSNRRESREYSHNSRYYYDDDPFSGGPSRYGTNNDRRYDGAGGNSSRDTSNRWGQNGKRGRY